MTISSKYIYISISEKVKRLFPSAYINVSCENGEMRKIGICVGGGDTKNHKISAYLTVPRSFSTRPRLRRDKAAKYARIWQIPPSPAHNAIFPVIRLYIG